MRALVPIVALVGACTTSQGDEGMVIVQNNAVGDTCTFTDPMPAFNPRGSLFLDSTVPYLFTPVVESRITAVVGQEQQKTVALQGARIDLAVDALEVVHADGTSTSFTFDAGELAMLKASGTTHFKSLFAAPLPPNAGRANVAFDIVPVSMLTAIKQKVNPLAAGDKVHAQLVATVAVYGDLAGDQVTSLKFDYPVTVCNDCIVNTLIDDMTNKPATCPLPMGAMPHVGNACNVFQDGVVDCCTNSLTKATVCPATVATM